MVWLLCAAGVALLWIVASAAGKRDEVVVPPDTVVREPAPADVAPASPPALVQAPAEQPEPEPSASSPEPVTTPTDAAPPAQAAPLFADLPQQAVAQMPAQWEETVPDGQTEKARMAQEIRYCLATKLRINAVKPIVDTERGGEVALHNQMVDSYNALCGRFKYEPSVYETVRGEVQAETSAIVKLARSAWLRRSLGLN